jgi:BirA family biotin operon repressor/biotin-[acetyl-CoA-carboxylase] ligase
MTTCTDQIRTKLSTKYLGQIVHEFQQIPSTNDEAMKLANQGAREGEVVIADQQTAGKGRMGRSWYSPPGRNLYLSVILRPPSVPHDAPRLTLVAGAACCEALSQLTNRKIKLKWPNDLLFKQRKLGGILSAAEITAKKVQFVVVGIGINVQIRQEEFPPELQQTATSLQAIGDGAFDRFAVAAAILNSFEKWYELFKDGQWPKIVAWCDTHNALKGQDVIVTCGNEQSHGRAENLDQEGHLVVRLASGETQTFLAGDVTVTHNE